MRNDLFAKSIELENLINDTLYEILRKCEKYNIKSFTLNRPTNIHLLAIDIINKPIREVTVEIKPHKWLTSSLADCFTIKLSEEKK